MKRRVASLALILCLLLSTLLPWAPGFAESPAEQVPAAEVAEEAAAEATVEATAEAPAEDFAEAPLPAPGLPEESAPATEAPAEAEEPAATQEPAESQEPEVAETPAPGSEQLPGDGDAGELPPEQLPLEELPVEPIDPANWPALGSSGEQYAGVVYLSRAAYDSMDADAQAAYVRMVDEFDATMEAGHPLRDVVFSLDEEGNVSWTYGIPLQTLFEAAAPSETVGVPAASDVVLEEIPLEIEDAAEPEAPEEPERRSVIPENVELAESLMPPIVSYGGTSPESQFGALFGSLDVENYSTLFWKNKDFFYKQLNSNQKKIYNFYKTAIVDDRMTGIDLEMSMSPSGNLIWTAMSAVINTYPYSFDFVNWGDPMLYVNTGRLNSGKYYARVAFKVADAYSASLETQARSKVSQLVSEAYQYARENYPDDVTYGIIDYFDDWICRNNYYNDVGTYESYKTSDAYYFCHCSYGVLLKGYGVCESYALTMTRLLDAAGIPNLYATGYVDDPGSGHAWNYVQMPDSGFYLVDSTYNDTSRGPGGASSRLFLLCANNERVGTRVPTGQRWNAGMKFSFGKISDSAYKRTSSDSPVMTRTAVYLAKGKSETLAVCGDYYQNYKISWSNSDSSVAALKNGKVTAKKPGKTVITQTFGDQRYSCTVYVYQYGGMSFEENKKSSLSTTMGVEAPRTIILNVNMKESGCTAEELVNQGIFEPVTVTNNNVLAADVAYSLEGNQIQLNVYPWEIGKSTVTIKFAKKTAKLTLNVRKPLDASWFSLDFGKISFAYDGKAKKPDVLITGSAPSGLRKGKDFTVKYLDNTDAGTATVRIEGKGLYGGVIDKTFAIEKRSILSASIATGKSRTKSFNGTVQAQSVTVKLNGRKLKAGKDYRVGYAYLGANNQMLVTESPRDAHVYALMIVGLNNYTGVLDPTSYADQDALVYTIDPVALSDVKVTLAKSVKYTGKPVTTAALKITVKIGSKKLTEGVDYGVEYVYPGATGSVFTPPTEKGTYKACIRPVANGNITLPSIYSVKSGIFTIK